MKYALIVKEKRAALASAQVIAPLTRKAAERLAAEMDGTIRPIESAPLARVIYTFKEAGMVPLMDWQREEEALIERVRGFGFPESSRLTEDRRDFEIVAEFETTSEDDMTADERAAETLAELQSLWSHAAVEMREEGEDG